MNTWTPADERRAIAADLRFEELSVSIEDWVFLRELADAVEAGEGWEELDRRFEGTRHEETRQWLRRVMRGVGDA